jgi:hypothetical protein
MKHIEAMNLTRFSMDMDGSMEPDEHGQWVRADEAIAAIEQALATHPAQDDNDFPLGKACDLSGEGTCEACQ